MTEPLFGPEPTYIPSRIVSGGQTGVDRAALDVAIAIGIEHGGWCPAGRLAEDGVVPPQYDLRETDSHEYPVRTELNVADSDATLILYEGKLKGGTLLTQKICKRLNKPFLTLAIDRRRDKQNPADQVRHWLYVERPPILNVAGPRESTCPGIFHRSMDFLLRALSLERS